ncbi:hypothetical protein Cni_G09654 [Canna indica]|uniref:Reverse transcriptase domain-containing protein n=1 Tax=Canna indica TaxID=4628 RepID=A0AAQ3K8I0_9LILI|nr:hypothetical protein Cni_G09654 [Canna indica]
MEELREAKKTDSQNLKAIVDDKKSEKGGRRGKDRHLHEQNNSLAPRPLSRPENVRSLFKGDKSKMCEFHQTYGHATEECVVLRDQIELLTREGRLNHYIRRDRSRSQTRRSRQQHRSPSNTPPPGDTDNHHGSESEQRHPDVQGVIHYIMGVFVGEGSPETQPSRTIMIVNEAVRPQRPHVPTPILYFYDTNFQGVDRNLHDPIIISVLVVGFLVRKVLVDQGSSVDVLFYPTLEKMDTSESSLHPYHGELVNFSRDHVNIKDYLWITTQFGSTPRTKTIDIQFLVVQCASPYRMIMGRPSLNNL